MSAGLGSGVGLEVDPTALEHGMGQHAGATAIEHMPEFAPEVPAFNDAKKRVAVKEEEHEEKHPLQDVRVEEPKGHASTGGTE